MTPMKTDLQPAPHNRTRQDDLTFVLGSPRLYGPSVAPARVLHRRAQVGIARSHALLGEVSTIFEPPRLTPEQLLATARHFREMEALAQETLRLPRTLLGLKTIAAADHALSVAGETLDVIAQTASRGGHHLTGTQLLTQAENHDAAARSLEQPEGPTHRVTCYGRRAAALAQLETVCFAITQSPPLNQWH